MSEPVALWTACVAAPAEAPGVRARRFLLGSVPNKISHHAPCSVLIVRTT